MSTFAEDFESKFRIARERVSPRPDHRKPNGQSPHQSAAALSATDGVSVDDFHAYMPMHAYIFIPTGELWPASSIDSRFPRQQLVDRNGRPMVDKADRKIKTIKASQWLDKYKPVEQTTWAPGKKQIIEGWIVSEGGWIERPGCKIFNLYRPPIVVPQLGSVERWTNLVHQLYGDNAKHIERWLAHRVQRPQEKINHALVLGGGQGIGKDTLLVPVKYAIGPWNFSEVSPQQMLGRFNGFAKSVVCRVSEARDLGDLDRYAFYDHTKTYIAAPPDVLRVDEKNMREYSVPNVIGIIITTNHKTDGIYLPADDRRHFVAWSDLTKDDFTKSYWVDLYRWYETGGIAAVAAYLAELDLSGFDPNAPPPKTTAFWEIVDASRAPEDAELADVIESLGSPDALTLEQIGNRAPSNFGEWLRDRKNARRIPHRLESSGYVAVRNDGAKDGHWKVDGRRQVIYAKAALSQSERIAAAYGLIRR
jgi:hypothetical protein